MRVPLIKDPVPAKQAAFKVAPTKTGTPKQKAFKQSAAKGFNPQPGDTSLFGSKAMKSPEDYETAEAVQGLGKSASPYYAQQYAKNGRSLRYDTATNTYR